MNWWCKQIYLLQEATQESKNLLHWFPCSCTAHTQGNISGKSRKKKEWPHSHATGMRCEKPPPLHTQHIWPWITESVHCGGGARAIPPISTIGSALCMYAQNLKVCAAFSRKIGRTQSLGLLFSNLQKNILRKKVIFRKVLPLLCYGARAAHTHIHACVWLLQCCVLTPQLLENGATVHMFQFPVIIFLYIYTQSIYINIWTKP